MTEDSRPVGPDSPLCETLSCLPEKFVVDFANGIDIVRDHLKERSRRSGFFARMLDGFKGDAAQRQARIDTSLADGLEDSLRWLHDLSESVVSSSRALNEIMQKMAALKENLATVAHHSADVKEHLFRVADRLDARLDSIAEETRRIGFIQKVQLNIDAVFSKWAGGRFAGLAPAGRCYVALEELRWGALGDYCRSPQAESRQRQEFLQIVVDRATHQLSLDAAISLDSATGMLEVWLAAPASRQGRHQKDLSHAVAYLADGMTVEAAPFATSAALMPANLPPTVPLVARPRRIASAMVHELITSEIRND